MTTWAAIDEFRTRHRRDLRATARLVKKEARAKMTPDVREAAKWKTWARINVAARWLGEYADPSNHAERWAIQFRESTGEHRWRVQWKKGHTGAIASPSRKLGSPLGSRHLKHRVVETPVDLGSPAFLAAMRVAFDAWLERGAKVRDVVDLATLTGTAGARTPTPSR